jgi:hypothetical protein
LIIVQPLEKFVQYHLSCIIGTNLLVSIIL